MAGLRRRPRADGGISYQVQWVLGGGRATRGQIEQTETFTSRSRALAFKAELEEEGHRCTTNPDGVRWTKGLGYVSPIVEGDRAPSTFHEVAVSYFEYQTRMMKRGHLKPYTLHRYRRSYELHLSTTFGPTPFSDIQTLDIEDWMVEQRDLPSTGKSIRNRHGLLFSILAHGQKRLGLRPDNPAELTPLPSKDGELGRRSASSSTANGHFSASCMRSDVHLLVDIALATGLRLGELTALRREDFSFPDRETVRIHVVRSWSKRAPGEDTPINRAVGESSTWKLGPPKSKRSRHVVVRGQDAIRLRESVAHHSPRHVRVPYRGGQPLAVPRLSLRSMGPGSQ